MSAPRRWVTVLETPPPARIIAVCPRAGDRSWVSEIATALVSLSAACPPEEVTPVGEALGKVLDRRAPAEAVILRRELTRSPDISGLARGLRPALLRALEKGEPFAKSLEGWLSEARAVATLERFVSATMGWIELGAATQGLLRALSLREELLDDPSARERANAKDGWLRWTHGRRKLGLSSAEASDQDVAVRSGRAHHFATLLQALSASTAALFDLGALSERLALRDGAPEDWSEVLDRLILRLPLIDGDDEAEDIRGSPLIKAAATWARLGEGAGASSLGAALRAMSRDVSGLVRAAADGPVWPCARFERAQGGLRSLRGGELAQDRSHLVWIGEIILDLREGRAVGPLGDLSNPAIRSSAALAHALHDSADNFAARVFPSVHLWPLFIAEIGPWMAGSGAAVLMPCRAVLPVELVGWWLRDAGGRPWSASRLFIEATRALIRGEGRLPDDLFHTSDLRLRGLIPSLQARLDAFLGAASLDARGRAAREREQGLRWSSRQTCAPGDESFFANICPEGAVDDSWKTIEEALDEKREQEQWRDASGATWPTQLQRSDPCALCDAVRALVEEDPIWAEADPPRRQAWRTGPLARGLQTLHQTLHASGPSGSCKECAARLLPLAAGAVHAAAAALLADLSDTGERVDTACGALTRDLAQSIDAYHRERHGSAQVAASEQLRPSAKAPQIVQLRVARDRIEGLALIDGQRRVATETLGDADARFALATLDASRDLLNPAASEAISRLVGATLGEILLQRNMGRLWDAALHNARARGAPLRMHLLLDDGQHERPWELVCDPAPQGRALVIEPDVAIIRVLARGAPARRAEGPERVRVLLVTAGLPQAVTSREIASLAGSGADLRVVERADLTTLTEALRDGPWTALHLACHGEPGRLMLQDGLALDAHALGELVYGRVSLAVVLNCCWGARTTRASASGADWSGLAGALLDRGVPHVIGALTPMSHANALALAEAWLPALVAGADPIAATSLARRAIRDRNPHGPSFGLIQHFTTAVEVV